jgi:hypothetical protein
VPAAAVPKAAAEPRAVALRVAVQPEAAANQVAVAASPAAAHRMQGAVAPLAVVRAVFPLPVVPAVAVAAEDLRAAVTRAAVAAV